MGNLHKKPTPEELQANIDASLETLKTIPEVPPVVPEPPVVIPPVVPEPPVVIPEAVIPVVTPPVVPEVPVVIVPGEVDYKKKFSESSREAQVQGFKNKEIQTAVDAAAQIPDPSEEDLKVAYPTWEEMTETEQMLAKDNLLNKRRFELVHEATEKFKKVDEWTEQVDTYTGDPKTLIAHPELEGKVEEFKQFVSKPSRRGIDLEDLVLAFGGEQAKIVPVVHKGQMFEQGSSGTLPDKPKDDKISLEESKILQKSNYKLWKEKLIAGKIRNE